jgi:hypothetical protein
MFHELMFMSKKNDNPYPGFLMILSFFKYDMPWIYEIGKETYEILKKTNTIESMERAIDNFRRMIKQSHHPMFMEMNVRKDSFRMMDEIMFFREEFLARMIHHNKE